ncbi:MAG: PKD domain-containing protein, partial [Flavisolibacter sp.]
KAIGQDTASFNYTFGLNNQVIFTNSSHLHGDASRKAVWLFGDGAKQVTAPLANTYHIYAVGGSYTACLKIYKYTSTNDSVVSAEVCKTITLSNTTTSDSCRIEFSNVASSTTLLTQGFVAQPWHNHGKKPEELCWNFGDGHDTYIKYDPSLSNNYSIYHIYSRPGQYNVCVRARYQGGCISEFCRVINIPGTECRADFTTESVTASPLSRHFIAQPWHISQKKPLRVCWSFGDGTTECKEYLTTNTAPYAINHTYAKAGQYNVCVAILYDGGCESKSCKTITIEPPPPPVDSCWVNIYEVAANVNNLERHFYAGIMQDRRPERLCWIFGDGKDTCISVPNPLSTQSLVIEHRYPAPGVYHVCVKVKYANGCEAQKCREVAIRSASNICGGYMVDSMIKEKTFAFRGFSIQNPNDRPVTWRWTFGDGSSSSDQNVNHTYAVAGNYEVCLYIKTDMGCETKICKHLAVQGENRPNLVLAPNPVTTTLHATFISLLQEQVTINIYNANGLLLKTYSRVAVQGSNTWDFDVSTLPAGIYSVIVSSPHQLANAIFFKH